MPRARNIKPGFFKDAKIVACSFEARLLFQGLWCLADYKGRLKYVPLEIKMEVFPGDNVDVEKCMSELSDQGLIQIYHDHSGSALVQVRNFELHQNPHVNERQDKKKNPLPCLPSIEDCEKLRNESQEKVDEKESIKQRVNDALRVLREYSESDPADSLLLIPDSLLLLPEEVMSSTLDSSAKEIFDYWVEVMGKTKTAYSKERKSKILARLKDGYTVEEIKTAIVNCSNTPHNMGDNSNGKTYNDIELICRNASKLEQFRDNPGKPNHEGQASEQHQSNYSNGDRKKLSTVEQASIANQQHFERIQRQIEELEGSEARSGNDETLGVSYS